MNKHAPVFKVRTPSQDITGHLDRNLAEMRFSDRSGVHADSFDIELTDDGSFSLPVEGSRLTASIGYQGGVPRVRSELFVDQIESSGPPARVLLSATSADFSSDMRSPREKAWRNVTLQEVLAEIAGRHDFDWIIRPQKLAEVFLFQVDQAGRSDLELLHDLAKDYGAVFKPIDGKLFMRSYDEIGDPVATIRPEDVSTWRAHFKARSVYSSVVAVYQDFDLARRIQVQAGEGQPQKMMEKTFVDEPTARANARAKLAEQRRGARSLTLRMPGRPDLASQQVIALDGFRERLNDRWLITEVVHTINKRGYSCRVECEGI